MARSMLIVEIDLDPVPGWGHSPEDHKILVERLLKEKLMPHYNPQVYLPADQHDHKILGHMIEHIKEASK